MKKIFLLLIFTFCYLGCATYETKYAQKFTAKTSENKKKIAHTLYLIGDAGLSPKNDLNAPLKLFKARLDKASENSTAIFLGDNIYPSGFPDKEQSITEYNLAKNHLDAQLKTLESFKGYSLFIPGNHDWYSDGLVGLKRQEKYIESKLEQKDPFLPENGCPIDVLKVSDDLAVIVIDTEWYMTNWDKHPTINDDCEIKSRAMFWEEVEKRIKKNRDKTTVIALHHPMFTYGPHGGQYSLKQQLFPVGNKVPLPVLGSVVNVLRKTTGASPADIQNKRYNEFKNRMVTLAQFSDKVIFVSGHEHTLQYIKEFGIPQIISGSGAKQSVARVLNGSEFASSQLGYAILDIFEDGSSRVRYYGVDENLKEALLFETDVLPPHDLSNLEKYPNNFPPKVSASIYSEAETDKSGFYKKLWGNRYRELYSTKVLAPTVNLDTLFGGLVPVRKGGGNQSKSLRLRHESGKEYVMRALRKVPEIYLQAMVFKNEYLVDDLQDTYIKEFIQDFYTGSHPYAPFVTATLSDAVGIYHSNPKLYYISKQSALLDYNNEFGDQLYMIEEHAGDGHGDLASFGYSNTLVSTDDLLNNLREDEKYDVDARLYARARLFDMVLGDWDRHVDQWRWAEFKHNNSKKITYKPVPRDRDQVFSIMGDGAFMNIATRLIPALRLMEGFNENIRSVEGFNSSPRTYVLDMAVLSETTKTQWLKEAAYIQEHLTAEVIDKAFLQFPEEIKDASLIALKQNLLSRINNLEETAIDYYKVLNKNAVVVGTDKDDWFDIEKPNKETVIVSAYRNIGGEKKKLFFKKAFKHQDTKEIWIYGLDDTDKFEIKGEYRSKIKIRIIGGNDKDTYYVDHGKNVNIYDHKSRKNNFDAVTGAKIKLTDNYKINTYQPLKIRNSFNQILPNIGFNPDTGVKLGVKNTYTHNSLVQNPYTQRHMVSANYFFATSGLELDYKGEFAYAVGKANLEIAALFTSPNYAINFFGVGNQTKNVDDDFGLNFNRVRLATIKLAPSLVWRGDLGSSVKAGISFEAIEVEKTENRFINTFYNENNIDNSKTFGGVHAQYTFENADNPAFNTMGMSSSIAVGYKKEINGDGGFGYIIPSLSINHRLIPSGDLVLATKLKAHFNIGNDFQFYQAASIGGENGLRGYRNERFVGKKAFYQNTDLRLHLGKLKTGIFPSSIGVYGGFDYGRVWNPNEDSNIWHTSYGGGVFLNASGLASLRVALFNSVEGPRFSFGLGFGF